MEALTIIHWPIVEKALRGVPCAENQVMVSRSMKFDRNWNGPIYVKHRASTRKMSGSRKGSRSRAYKRGQWYRPRDTHLMFAELNSSTQNGRSSIG